jgi:hypothetical protein
MTIELQILSSVLGDITSKAVQERVRKTCFAPVGSVYVDHADVPTTPVEVFAANATVRLRVPLNVFVVQRSDVLAAPNAVPAGAPTVAGTVILVLELPVIGTVLSVTCIDADLGAFGQAWGPAATAAKTAIVGAIGSAVTSSVPAAWFSFEVGSISLRISSDTVSFDLTQQSLHRSLTIQANHSAR